MDAGVCNVKYTFAACLKWSNRAEFVHFVLLFLHAVAPLQSSVAPPSSKTKTEAFVLVSLSLMAPLPCFHPPLVNLTSTLTSLFIQTDLKMYLVVNFKHTSTFPIPVSGILWLCVWNVLFSNYFFFFFFSKSQARSLIFLDDL